MEGERKCKSFKRIRGALGGNDDEDDGDDGNDDAYVDHHDEDNDEYVLDAFSA